MLAIDIIGLVMTVCLIGIRYPHFVLGAAIIHDMGRVVMALFLHGNIESIVAAGAFGSTDVSNLNSVLKNAVIILSGPLANYMVSATVGGIERERTINLFNPCATLQSSFAVINLRLAILSFLVNLWHFF